MISTDTPPAEEGTKPPMQTLIDGHVHLHPGSSVAAALSAAAAAFAAASGSPTGMLCLTESRGVDAFSELAGGTSGSAGHWTVELTDEPESLLCSHRGGGSILVVAGRQVVTAERLEVLGLGTRMTFDDGMPMAEAIRLVQAAGAITVIPWGFGKWWGGRGKTVLKQFAGADPATLFLGDNGGRYHGTGTPRLLLELAGRGFRVLPGSDPLPFSGQAARVGSAGFALEGSPEPARPAQWLRGTLADTTVVPRQFGSGTQGFEFLRAQIGMQWRKRTRRPA